MQHGHIVDWPAFTGVLSDDAQNIHHHAVALQGGGVVSIEQRHVVQNIRQLRQVRSRVGVGDGEDFTGSQGSCQFQFVVGHVAAVVESLYGVLRQIGRS